MNHILSRSIMLMIFIICSSPLYSQYQNDDTVYHEKGRTVGLRESFSSRSNYIMIRIYMNGRLQLKDSVEKQTVYLHSIVDFDGDGNTDIIVTSYSNNVTSNLFRFDSARNGYVNVKHFEDFPEALAVTTNPHIFYSYHRAGCADMNWVSDLFVIKNNSAVQLGHIYTEDCGDEKHVISISKVNGKKMTLVKTSPTIILGEFPNYKWGYIADYWGKNYKKFL